MTCMGMGDSFPETQITLFGWLRVRRAIFESSHGEGVTKIVHTWAWLARLRVQVELAQKPPESRADHLVGQNLPRGGDE